VRLSHRQRLTLITTAATGVMFAAMFAGMAEVERESTLNERKYYVTEALKNFTPAEDPKFDLREFTEAHPELAVATFDANGVLDGRAGPFALTQHVGILEDGNHLSYGEDFKGQTIVIGIDLADTFRGLTNLDRILILMWFPLTMSVWLIVGYTARAVFRPLERLTAQAVEMSGNDLADRLDTADQAEFGAFALQLNAMLERIQSTVKRGEQFSQDAAHELRTPLAILRTRLETALLQPRTPAEYQETLARAVKDIERLTNLSESLLRSARGEAAPAPPADLISYLDLAPDRWRPRFFSKSVDLVFDPGSTATNRPRSKILPDELAIVIDNLLDNALRYSPPASMVTIRLAREGNLASVTVRDQGMGVPPDLGDRIFDRLVRADDSRNRESGGAGIGLAVCRQIIQSRGGQMFQSNHPEGGAEIGFTLPIA